VGLQVRLRKPPSTVAQAGQRAWQAVGVLPPQVAFGRTSQPGRQWPQLLGGARRRQGVLGWQQTRRRGIGGLTSPRSSGGSRIPALVIQTLAQTRQAKRIAHTTGQLAQGPLVRPGAGRRTVAQIACGALGLDGCIGQSHQVLVHLSPVSQHGRQVPRLTGAPPGLHAALSLLQRGLLLRDQALNRVVMDQWLPALMACLHVRSRLLPGRPHGGGRHRHGAHLIFECEFAPQGRAYSTHIGERLPRGRPSGHSPGLQRPQAQRWGAQRGLCRLTAEHVPLPDHLSLPL